MKIKVRRKLPLAIGGLLLLLILLTSTSFFPNRSIFYLNLTGSEPIGIYRVVPPDTLQDGDMVVMHVPEPMHSYVYGRGWLPKGQSILKTVYAVPGETYSISDTEILVKGNYVGPIFAADRKGLPLPILRGSFIVQEDHFLPIASRMPNSFDGRYFGEVSTQLIIAKVVPLLLFPEGLF